MQYSPLSSNPFYSLKALLNDKIMTICSKEEGETFKSDVITN